MTLFDIAYDDFKREDTTNTIVITLYTDDKHPITPNASHTWKAKVSKGDKYVGEYPVTISGNTIKLSSSNLTRLPNGDYGLELWETYDGSTTIYPSAGVMEFRVHRNANDTMGTVDPTTDINGIIDDLHKAGQNIKVVATNTLSPGSKASVTQSITNGENQLTFNIPQGNKGEKGEVGPAPTLKIGTVTKLNSDQAPTASLSGGNGSYTLDLGIPQGIQGKTNPTATQALDIANSVNSKLDGITSNGGGRNLLQGTRDFSGISIRGDKVAVTNGGEKFQAATGTQDPNAVPIDYDIVAFDNLPLEKDTDYTASFWAKASEDINIASFLFNSGSDGHYSDGVVVNHATTDYKRFVVHFHNGNNTATPSFIPLRITKLGVTVWLYGCMLEKGTVAHDWSPAPEDIQTQLDALKEAVKKLGGDNLAPLVAPVMSNVGAETESVTHGHAQRFVLPLKGTELLPKTNILVDVLSGDTLSQSFVIETDATSIDGAFTFYMMSSDHHVVPFNVQQLTATKYLISASYTTENDDKWRILDIMRLNLTGGTYVEFSNPYAAIDLSGGVVQTNLLADWATKNALGNWTTNDTTVQSKITNAVLSFDVKSSSLEYVDFYQKDVNLTPGHTYKLSYMARGTGIVRSHLYAWTNKGTTSATDSIHFTTLTDDWQESTQTIKYDPTSDNSSNTKHFLFRWKKSDCESLTGQISDLELIDVTE
ncbi:hypothetical protein ACLUW9_09075 [Limosilactobacillus mucosae]|uniref:hypothetical protein n=1 Tax=Limosilactobacillus mucosae TaxID=97478 RepID=UPI0039925A3C